MPSHTEFPTLFDIQDDDRYKNAAQQQRDVFVARWFSLAHQEGRRRFGDEFDPGLLLKEAEEMDMLGFRVPEFLVEFGSRAKETTARGIAKQLEIQQAAEGSDAFRLPPQPVDILEDVAKRRALGARAEGLEPSQLPEDERLPLTEELKLQFQIGHLITTLGPNTFAAFMTGTFDLEAYSAKKKEIAELEKRLPQDVDFLNPSELGRAMLGGTTQLSPMIIQAAKEAGIVGLGAGVLALAVPVAGEVAAPVVAGIGAVTGGAWFSYRLETGLAYGDLRERGVSHETAASVAPFVGFLSASLEVAGLGLLARSVGKPVGALARKIAGEVATGIVGDQSKKSIIRSATRAVGKVAALTGAETGIELGQEFTQIGGDALGVAIENEVNGANLPQVKKEEIIARLKGVTVESLLAFPLLAAPGAVLGFAADTIPSPTLDQVEEDTAFVQDIITPELRERVIRNLKEQRVVLEVKERLRLEDPEQIQRAVQFMETNPESFAFIGELSAEVQQELFNIPQDLAREQAITEKIDEFLAEINASPRVVPETSKQVLDPAQRRELRARMAEQGAFTDGNSGVLLDYLNRYMPARVVAALNKETRLQLGNDWMALRDYLAQLPAEELQINQEVTQRTEAIIDGERVKGETAAVPVLESEAKAPLQPTDPAELVKEKSEIGLVNSKMSKPRMVKEARENGLPVPPIARKMSKERLQEFINRKHRELRGREQQAVVETEVAEEFIEVPELSADQISNNALTVIQELDLEARLGDPAAISQIIEKVDEVKEEGTIVGLDETATPGRIIEENDHDVDRALAEIVSILSRLPDTSEYDEIRSEFEDAVDDLIEKKQEKSSDEVQLALVQEELWEDLDRIELGPEERSIDLSDEEQAQDDFNEAENYHSSPEDHLSSGNHESNLLFSGLVLPSQKFFKFLQKMVEKVSTLGPFWLVDNVRRINPVMGDQLAEEILGVVDRTKEIMGGLSDSQIRANTVFNKNIRGYWDLQDVTTGAEGWGTRKIVDAVEGRIPEQELSKQERKIVKTIREFNIETGKVLEDSGMQIQVQGFSDEDKVRIGKIMAAASGRIPMKKVAGENRKIAEEIRDRRVSLDEQEGLIIERLGLKEGLVWLPFKAAEDGKVFVRLPTMEMFDILLKGPSSGVYRKMVTAFADKNGISEASVDAAFREVHDTLLNDFGRGMKRHNAEFARRWREIPTTLSNDGVDVPLFETSPDGYMSSLAWFTGHRVAFIEKFGQTSVDEEKSEAFDKLKEQFVRTSNNEGAASSLFDGVMRSINGMPAFLLGKGLLRSSLMPEPGRKYYIGRIFNSLIGVNKALNLSLAAVPNLPEPISNTGVFLGYRRMLRAMWRDRWFSDARKADLQWLRRAGVVTADMVNFNLDRTRTIDSMVNKSAEFISRAGLIRFINENQENFGGFVGRLFAEDMQKGRSNDGDRLTLSQLGYSAEDANRLSKGKGKPEEYVSIMRRIPPFLQGSAALGVEKGLLRNTRGWNFIFPFLTYFSTSTRQLVDLTVKANGAWEEVESNPTVENKKKMNVVMFRAAKFIAGKAASGVIANTFMSLIYGGLFGLEQEFREARRNPVGFLVDSALYSIFGGLLGSLINLSKRAATSEEWLSGAWRAAYPIIRSALLHILCK